MKTNGVKYGLKSSKPYEITRRAKRKGITPEILIKQEEYEQNMIDKGFKFCISCDNWKNFGKAKTYCKECCAEKTRNKYDLNKQREYLLKKKYGITLQKYNEILHEQNYKCYICQKHEDKLDRALAVDHCHDTLIVRGLLCGNCNRFLGQINDSIETAKKMVEYLEQFKENG
jgi:hypothetical protein